MTPRSLIAVLLLALGACGRADADAGRARDTTAGGAAVAARDTAPARIPLVPTPDPVRGLYVNRWAAIGEKMGQLTEVAKRTEVNALVIDV